jgi:hypothetical protein
MNYGPFLFPRTHYFRVHSPSLDADRGEGKEFQCFVEATTADQVEILRLLQRSIEVSKNLDQYAAKSLYAPIVRHMNILIEEIVNPELLPSVKLYFSGEAGKGVCAPCVTAFWGYNILDIGIAVPRYLMITDSDGHPPNSENGQSFLRSQMWYLNAIYRDYQQLNLKN